MAEEGLGPREATRKSMDQITGALVAIALVLAAVFVPMAFFGGSIGVIYRQFSITLVSAMAPVGAGGADPHAGAVRHDPQAAAAVGARGAHGLLQVVQHVVRPRPRTSTPAASMRMLGRTGRSMLVYRGHRGGHGRCCSRGFPRSFLPNEDTGFMYGQVQTPPGASKERTWAALDKAQQYLTEQEKDTVEGVLTVNGFNFAGTGQNSGLLFIKLRDWDERTEASQQMPALAGARQQVFLQHQGSQHHRRAAAGGARAGQYRRLRHDAAEPRRTAARGLPGGAQPVAGRGRQGSAPGRRASQRRRRRAAVQARHRSREGQRARRVHRRHQPDAADRLGVDLRE